MVRKNWFIVGVSGVTCGGKTTLTKALHQRYPFSVTVCQDDYFLPEDSDKHTLIPELNHFNWDILTAFDMDKMRTDVERIINSESQDDFKLLIIEGVLILNDEYLSKLFNKKYYITLPYDVCVLRRSKRTYNPPDVPGYFEACVWPEYVRSKEDALKMNPDIQLIDGVTSADVILETVSYELDKLLEEFKCSV